MENTNNETVKIQLELEEGKTYMVKVVKPFGEKLSEVMTTLLTSETMDITHGGTTRPNGGGDTGIDWPF